MITVSIRIAASYDHWIASIPRPSFRNHGHSQSVQCTVILCGCLDCVVLQLASSEILPMAYSPSPRPELAPVIRTTLPWIARRPAATRRRLRIFETTATTARAAITAPPPNRLIILPSMCSTAILSNNSTLLSCNLLVIKFLIHNGN